MQKQKILTELFDAHFNALCYFANSFLKDQDNAKDLVQDAFVGLWYNSDKIQETKENSLAYLYRTVRNKCLNYIRDKKVRDSAQDNIRLDTEMWEQDHVHKLIKAEIVGIMHHSLEQLPFKCKQIIKMSFLHGMSEQDIAETLSVSVSTVKNQKKRGKQLLKEELDKLLLLLMAVLN